MGYYTYWSIEPLEVESAADRAYFERALEYMRDMSEDAKESVEVDGSTTSDPTKWYEWANDMRLMSMAFPDIVFVLKADGEDDDGRWVEYWRGGKVQHEDQVITYGEFDEGRLK